MSFELFACVLSFLSYAGDIWTSRSMSGELRVHMLSCHKFRITTACVSCRAGIPDDIGHHIPSPESGQHAFHLPISDSGRHVLIWDNLQLISRVWTRDCFACSRIPSPDSGQHGTSWPEFQFGIAWQVMSRVDLVTASCLSSLTMSSSESQHWASYPESCLMISWCILS